MRNRIKSAVQHPGLHGEKRAHLLPGHLLHQHLLAQAILHDPFQIRHLGAHPQQGLAPARHHQDLFHGGRLGDLVHLHPRLQMNAGVGESGLAHEADLAGQRGFAFTLMPLPAELYFDAHIHRHGRGLPDQFGDVLLRRGGGQHQQALLAGIVGHVGFRARRRPHRLQQDRRIRRADGIGGKGLAIRAGAAPPA
jgi:hypothetical protein